MVDGSIRDSEAIQGHVRLRPRCVFRTDDLPETPLSPLEHRCVLAYGARAEAKAGGEGFGSGVVEAAPTTVVRCEVAVRAARPEAPTSARQPRPDTGRPRTASDPGSN